MSMSEPDRHAAAWQRAVTVGGLGPALEAIYAEATKAIAERGPACWASGRCCHFEQYGHRLYVTGLEAAYTVARWNAGRPTPLTIAGVETAHEAGGCPFQRMNLCEAHAIKPLGCRVYFCDRTAQEWQNTLLEALHARVKALHTPDIPYEYGEWRFMLRRFAR